MLKDPINTACGALPSRDSSSSLDTLETSTHQTPANVDYRAHLKIEDNPEYAAARSAYEALDVNYTNKRVDQLQQCRSRAWFVLDTETRRVKVVSNACRLRWCPVCAEKRRYVIRNSVQVWAAGRKDLRFLTLTLKHSDKPLAAQLSLFDKFYRNFRRNKTVVQYVTGGIWFLEVKFNPKSGEWHPHYHMLIEGAYLPKALVSRIWLETTGDSMIVDIRSAANTERVAAYIAKYSSKPAELTTMDTDHVLCLMLCLHNKRLVSCFGSAYGLKLSTISQIDKVKCVKLCSWRTLISLYRYVYDARIIWDCYTSGESLPTDVSIRDTERFLDGEYLEIDIPPPKPPEPLLWS